MLKINVNFLNKFHAEIHSSKLAELSLADLEQKALFLPRSAISENLEEIGHGELIVDARITDYHTLQLTVGVIGLIDSIIALSLLSLRH